MNGAKLVLGIYSTDILNNKSRPVKTLNFPHDTYESDLIILICFWRSPLHFYSLRSI